MHTPDEILRMIVNATASKIAEDFFEETVRSLTKILNVEYAFIGELIHPEDQRVRTLATCAAGKIIGNFAYDLQGTPCENVFQQNSCVFPEKVQESFPSDALLQEMGVQSYMGTSLIDAKGENQGILVLLDTRKLNPALIEQAKPILELYAARSSAELSRIRTERALRERERRLRTSDEELRRLFAAMTTGFSLQEVIYDEDGTPCDFRFLSANAAFESISGFNTQQLVGKTGTNILPDLASHLIPKLGSVSGTGTSLQFEFADADGGRFFEIKAYSPEEGKFAILLNEITERVEASKRQEELEAQLRQVLKMEAVGQLAGGVAHDFNNLLQVINGYTDFIIESPDDPSFVQETAGKVLEAGERAAELIHQLLAFSRQQVLKLEPLDLNEVLSSILGMLNRVIGAHIHVKFEPGNPLVSVLADRGQLEQVIMNVCVNARDAMPDGGTLSIKTKGSQCSDSGEGVVLLRISDSGVGMSDEVRKQIFEPFFTTKSIGKGTGLGLATVYGIIQQHKGRVAVSSIPGEGSQFDITLPCSMQGAKENAEPTRPKSEGGEETILVAEDDEMVRSLIVDLLRDYGYTVLEANDGREAIQLCQDYSGRVDLALLDVVMPELGGKAVFDTLRPQYPEMKFLFASGYSRAEVMTNFIREDAVEWLQKPYPPKILLGRLRAILDR